jgi:hypothetical protein
VGVASPGKSRKSDFVSQRRGSNTSNRSEVSANVTFLAKLNNKEKNKKEKIVSWLFLINLIACPTGVYQHL